MKIGRAAEKKHRKKSKTEINKSENRNMHWCQSNLIFFKEILIKVLKRYLDNFQSQNSIWPEGGVVLVSP